MSKPNLPNLIANLQQMPERYKLILALAISLSFMLILSLVLIFVNNILKQQVL